MLRTSISYRVSVPAGPWLLLLLVSCLKSIEVLDCQTTNCKAAKLKHALALTGVAFDAGASKVLL